MNETGDAAKKHAARDIDPEEIEGRIDDQLEQARFFSGRDPLLRLEPGVDDLLADLGVKPQGAFVPQQTFVRVSDFALRDQPLMHQHQFVEPHFFAPRQP